MRSPRRFRARRPVVPVPVVPVAVALALALVVTSCTGDEPPAPTTTTGTALPPRTTLPPVVTTVPGVTTTTTIPAEIATEVDACALVEVEDVRSVAGRRPGPGTPLEAVDLPGADRSEEDEEQEDPAVDPPGLLVAGCTWPTDGPPVVTLAYLAPTTATSGLEHLQRVVDLGGSFGRGARVLPVPSDDGLAAAALVDTEGTVLEIAVVRGSALLYVVPNEPITAGTPEAQALVGMLLAAAERAPG